MLRLSATAVTPVRGFHRVFSVVVRHLLLFLNSHLQFLRLDDYLNIVTIVDVGSLSVLLHQSEQLSLEARLFFRQFHTLIADVGVILCRTFDFLDFSVFHLWQPRLSRFPRRSRCLLLGEQRLPLRRLVEIVYGVQRHRAALPRLFCVAHCSAFGLCRRWSAWRGGQLLGRTLFLRLRGLAAY